MAAFQLARSLARAVWQCRPGWQRKLNGCLHACACPIQLQPVGEIRSVDTASSLKSTHPYKHIYFNCDLTLRTLGTPADYVADSVTTTYSVACLACLSAQRRQLLVVSRCWWRRSRHCWPVPGCVGDASGGGSLFCTEVGFERGAWSQRFF